MEQGSYWHPLLGKRPESTEEAVGQALGVVLQGPPLIPVFAHRYLCAAPLEGPRAVLSVWQAVDSIFIGNDLADYFASEFHIPKPKWAADHPPRVPFWEDLFDLWGEWGLD